MEKLLVIIEIAPVKRSFAKPSDIFASPFVRQILSRSRLFHCETLPTASPGVQRDDRKVIGHVVSRQIVKAGKACVSSGHTGRPKDDHYAGLAVF